ncbi:hypothetical protein F751_3432 [Auxenochlorella protothecoides]|uniref:Uncharacterized protein n=1 Tax=Auxenochlorella protothecoides TaxID=3075 RepID=A0A087SBY7_AUXPR|nr:hypothetical protein F751_3432 [Auxenochlorella protothecoides]KFM23241.1 hypothetical protein F751_3432 [Auxenochlorella protothecoides]
MSARVHHQAGRRTPPPSFPQDVLEAATRRAEGAEARAADAELALDSALDAVRELRAGNAELAGALEEARAASQSDAPTPRSAAPSDAGSPFGSDFTLRELLQRTAALEARLLEAGTEKNGLQAELARLPVSSAGRTIRERRRREEIEARLDDLEREMSGLRLELKRSGCR